MTFINKKFLTQKERTAYNRAVDKNDHKTEIKYITLAWDRFIDRYKDNRELFFKDVAEELEPYTKEKYRDLIKTFKDSLETLFTERDGVFYKQMAWPVFEVKTNPDGTDTYIETGKIRTAEVPFPVIIPKDSYKGFCSYLVSLLREYLRATDYLKDIGVTRADLMAVIEEHAQKYYNKPTYKHKKEISNPTPGDEATSILIVEDSQKQVEILNGPIYDQLNLITLSGGRADALKQIAARSEKINHRYNYIADGTSKSVKLTQISRDGKEEFSTEMPSNFNSYKTEVYTLLKYLLSKYSDGRIVPITYDQLIEDGIYSSFPVIRKNIDNVLNVLKGVALSYSRRRGKPFNISISGEDGIKRQSDAPMFSLIDRDNISGFTVYFNPDLNWKVLTQFFAPLPTYFFEAKPMSKRIIESVFSKARRDKKNKFTIRLFTIVRDCTPKEINSHAKGKIIDPIQKSIEEINEYNRRDFPGNEDLLTLHLEGNTGEEMIEHSYISVSIPEGELTNLINKVNRNKTKKIKETTKKDDNNQVK